MNLRRTARITAICITLAIWVLCLIPITQPLPGSDKLHHFAAYAALMLVWRLSMGASSLSVQVRLAIALMLMGVAIECAQGLTPYRSFEWADAAANATGVLIGWALANTALRVVAARWRHSK